MSDDSALRASIEALLADTLRTQRLHWSPMDPELARILERIESLVLAGGKRLRPRFCHWGWVAAGGDQSSSQQVRIGAAIELLHAAALLHDDVIDDASTRRGEPTAHRVLAGAHEAAAWAGDPRRFGEAAAILGGDITFVIADMLMDGVTRAARSLWHEMRMEVNIGQYLDMVGAARRDRTVEAAGLICRYKTAKYTVERPLHLGAHAADEAVGARIAPMLSAYALPIGEAFQMRDDLLDAFGDPRVTGKPVGGDLREGKPTALVAFAWASASESGRMVLDRIGSPGLDEGDIAAIQEVLRDTGAVAAVEQRITAMRDEAIAALDSNVLAGESHRALVELAVEVTSRAS